MIIRLILPTIMACLFCLLPLQKLRSEQTRTENIDSCIVCHSDTIKMKDLGFPQFTVTLIEVSQQSKMQAACSDCHAGNPNSLVKETAHTGLHRLLSVQTNKLEAVTRDKLTVFRPDKLETSGRNLMVEMLPKIEMDWKQLKDPSVQTILYHDKNVSDFMMNRKIQEETCGRCHLKEVEEFQRTAMGANTKQRAYKTWIDKDHGPHNCGPWFIDNWREIAKNTTVPFTQEMAQVNQKACNVCHTGCLDCHYGPKHKDPMRPSMGQHTFSKVLTPLTCYGGGRGSICHAGPEDRRRGGGYIGGSFSNPQGAEPDIHYKKGVACTSCHETQAQDETLLHGQVKRPAVCTKCHPTEVKALVNSSHKNVSCEACHIQDVGAYTATFWGPGKLAGIQTPFFKYKEYYGIMKEPILIRTPQGKWIPVKPYAMAVMNQKSAGGLKPGLKWRYPANLPDGERTDDAYAFVGLLSGLPSNDNVLAWIQMDKVSHKYGKSRSCESCHSSNGEQRQFVSWKYADQGAEPFEGSHIVVANSKGLFILDMQATTEIKPNAGSKIEDFAPWYYLKDKWHITGNFALPPIIDQLKYQKEIQIFSVVREEGGRYHR